VIIPIPLFVHAQSFVIRSAVSAQIIPSSGGAERDALALDLLLVAFEHRR
jgi:hypothetical protein